VIPRWIVSGLAVAAAILGVPGSFPAAAGPAAISLEGPRDFAVTFHYPVIKRPLPPEELTEAIVSTVRDPEDPAQIAIAGGEYELAVIGVHFRGGSADSGRGAGAESAGGIGGSATDAAAHDAAMSRPRLDLIIDNRTIPPGYAVAAYALPPFYVERKSRWFDSRGVTGAWFDPCVPLTPRITDRTIEFVVGLEGTEVVWTEGLAGTSTAGPAVVATEGTTVLEGGAGPGENRIGGVPDGVGSFAGSVYLLLEIRAPRADEGGGAPGDRYPFPLRVYARSPEGISRAVPPLEIVPYRFDLPREHTLPVLMGLEGDDVLEQHRLHGLLPNDEEALWLDYLSVLREHRIVPYNPLLREDFSWSEFEETAIPLYHGRLTPDGVPAPAIRFPENPHPRGSAERVTFYRDVADRLEEEGLLERSFYYVDDEPLIDDYTGLIEDAREIREVVPDLRTLVTEPYTPRLEGLIDIWCPDIPMYDPGVPIWPLYGKGSGLQPEFQVNHDPRIYKGEGAAGRELWMYTCTSAQVLDYPSLFIDARPAAHRIIPWVLHRHGATGFVYFRMTHAYRDGNDPWRNQFYFAANGDGTLLYPGYPGAHRAIPSLRMKIFRDGLEDYEYLLLAGAPRANASSDRSPVDLTAMIAADPREWEDDLGEIQTVRNEIASLIEEPREEPERVLRFNQVSLPSLVGDYWYVPGWAAPREDGVSRGAASFAVASYRHLLASALDTGHRSANAATRGRWQVYLQAGALLPLSGGAPAFGGYSAVGGTVSLETAEGLNRSWLIPYVGLEGGVLTGRTPGSDGDTFAGFAGSVLAGVHIWSTERSSLLVGGAWTHSTSDAVPVALRGTLGFDFILGKQE